MNANEAKNITASSNPVAYKTSADFQRILRLIKTSAINGKREIRLKDVSKNDALELKMLGFYVDQDEEFLSIRW